MQIRARFHSAAAATAAAERIISENREALEFLGIYAMIEKLGRVASILRQFRPCGVIN